MKLINKVGKKYGRLLVIERAEDKIHPNGKKSVVWRCRCDCGNMVEVLASNLGDHTKSCGCYADDKKIETHIKHGDSNSRLFHIWTGIKQRCTNTKNPNYKNYGGRGIKIYDPWKDYKTFSEWAKMNGYKNNLTIERIDVNGNYEPTNCCWIPAKNQCLNKRTNRYLEAYGKRQTITEWSRITGIPLSTIRNRLSRGWSIEEALHR